MSKPIRVLSIALGGIVSGYAGYWLGYLLGWSNGAEWQFRISGGTTSS